MGRAAFDGVRSAVLTQNNVSVNTQETTRIGDR
jgi:hypothetical protein